MPLSIYYPIWHLIHQLPGVVACPVHREYLISQKPNQRTISLPEMHGHFIANDSACHISSLIMEEFNHSEIYLDPLKIISTFKIKLSEKQLLTNCEHIRMERLSKEVKEQLIPLKKHYLYQYLFNSASDQKYPACLFYQNNCYHHPLKYLFMINVLFDSWVDFLTYYDLSDQFTFEVMQPLTKNSFISDLEERKRIAIEYVKNGSGLHQACKISGIGILTLRAVLSKLNIQKHTDSSARFNEVVIAVFAN